MAVETDNPTPASGVRRDQAQGPVAIEARGIDKSFRLPTHKVDSLKERLTTFSKREFRELRALRDVSFDVHRGEFFGIVGRNGSGKSTLLKILASIYAADAGRVRMAGRLAPFIELGVGFNPDLTARENVELNGVMMGLHRDEARKRLPAILEFAELEEFVDMKLKNYSSGMLVRLAFSVMIQSDAEILLIDEVLAVGDASFQQKCADVFHEMRDSDRTVVLVEAQLQSEDGAQATTVEAKAPLRLSAVFEARREVEGPTFGFALTNADDIQVAGVGLQLDVGLPDKLEPGQRVRVSGEIENRLAPGRYVLKCWVHRNHNYANLVLHSPHVLDFVVYGSDVTGVVAVDHDLRAVIE